MFSQHFEPVISPSKLLSLNSPLPISTANMNPEVKGQQISKRLFLGQQ